MSHLVNLKEIFVKFIIQKVIRLSKNNFTLYKCKYKHIYTYMHMKMLSFKAQKSFGNKFNQWM